MTELIHKWVQIARWAPSGGNAQPWRVTVSDLSVRISVDPDYRIDPSPMDSTGIAAAIALGAFAFTLECAAAVDGYKIAQKTIQSRASLWDGYVEIRFEPGDVEPRFSIAQIRSRQTERLPFSEEAIDPAVLLRLREIFNRVKGVRAVELTAQTSPSKIAIFKPLASLEKIRWQNSVLLGALLEEINFGKEEKSRVTGIPASQLGATVFELGLLSVIKRIKILRIALQVGFENLAIRKALGVIVRKSGALFFVQTEIGRAGNEFSACFGLGELFQEAWLEANASGLGFQPISLPLVALAHWRSGERTPKLSVEHLHLIETSTEALRAFGLDLKMPMMGFRIGILKKKSGQTLRKDVSDILARN